MSFLRSLPNAILILAASLSLASTSVTEHGINDCYDQEFATYNASSSIEFPSLTQNITDFSPENWKLSTAVKEMIDPQARTSTVKQKWWLDGDPNLPANASLQPIDGCIVLLQATPNSTFLGKGTANTTAQNGCSHVLTPACQNAMVNWVAWNITSFGANDLNSHWTVCPMIAHLLNEPPKECQADYRFDSIALEPFGNPDFIAPSENGCDNSTDFNIFAGSAGRNSFLELVSPTTAIGDHKMYDEIVENTNPVLLVSWPKNRTQGWFPSTQLACLTPSGGVVKGSRVPSSKNATGGKNNAASPVVQGESVFALWMLLLIVSFTL